MQQSLANNFGTFEYVEKNYSKNNKAIGADCTSMRKVRRYIVHSDDIKAIAVAQDYNKSPFSSIAKIQLMSN